MNAGGFQVHNDKGFNMHYIIVKLLLILLFTMLDQFSVIHQSDDATMLACEVVQLFCLASKHCSAYQYNR